MEMVSVGILPYVVVDDYRARVWATIFDKLVVREDLAVNTGGSIAWAIRRDSPKLHAELDRFVAAHKLGTTFGNIMKRRYFGNNRMLKSALAPADQARFRALAAIFQHYGEQYSIDYLMMGAQGFQESRLDQSLRSPYGAVGIMQVLPSTARELGITGVDKDADANIHAGVGYMAVLAKRYVNGPDLNSKNRILMTIAAYNAGPGNLARFRRRAARDGLDPNVWFGNVENEAAKIVGAETVQYLGNIKYYVAYSLLLERERQVEVERRKAGLANPESGPGPLPKQ